MINRTVIAGRAAVDKEFLGNIPQLIQFAGNIVKPELSQ